MAFGISDELLATFVPILVFWLYSGIYMMLGSLEKYRLHSKKEEDEKNLVSKANVIKLVLFQQAIQALMSLFVYSEDDKTPSKEHSLPIIVVQLIVAMVVVDTYQYFTHRFIYHNKYLYQYIHAQHHRLVVPYAFGALYASSLEILIDAPGYTLPILISGMSPRVSIFFFSFYTMKTVDDHSGLILPWNPFHIIFTCTTAYHTIHHHYGIKYNYANPFFGMWDKLFGTQMPYTLEKKESGGFEIRLLKDRKEK